MQTETYALLNGKVYITLETLLAALLAGDPAQFAEMEIGSPTGETTLLEITRRPSGWAMQERSEHYEYAVRRAAVWPAAACLACAIVAERWAA